MKPIAEGAKLTYYYSNGGLEKIVASLVAEYFSETIANGCCCYKHFE